MIISKIPAAPYNWIHSESHSGINACVAVFREKLVLSCKVNKCGFRTRYDERRPGPGVRQSLCKFHSESYAEENKEDWPRK